MPGLPFCRLPLIDAARLQGLAGGFVLLRFESLVEEGKLDNLLKVRVAWTAPYRSRSTATYSLQLRPVHVHVSNMLTCVCAACAVSGWFRVLGGPFELAEALLRHLRPNSVSCVRAGEAGECRSHWSVVSKRFDA